MVVERKIFVAASPETVFGFLVDGALMAQWFGLSHTLEPRPAGYFASNVAMATSLSASTRKWCPIGVSPLPGGGNRRI
jgi:uncharacterized protein YndB with AHSA1/START domain